MPPTCQPTRRLALLLHYDGAAFAGSQWQPNLPTVQGALQQAVAQLTRQPAQVSLAGRTDAGVHALGQVASFQTTRQLPERRWLRGLNHFLPESIAVQDIQTVADDFDPRRNATEREYRYQLLIAPQRRPLEEPRAWRILPPFSLDLACAALRALPGRRDFAAFTTTDQQRPTVRSLHNAELDATAQPYTLSFTADAFLQHQVRRMVGAVVEVARGRLPLDAFQATLHAARPGSAGPTAPAKGLTLAAVRYDRSILPPWPTEQRKIDHVAQHLDDCPQPA